MNNVLDFCAFKEEKDLDAHHLLGVMAMYNFAYDLISMEDFIEEMVELGFPRARLEEIIDLVETV